MYYTCKCCKEVCNESKKHYFMNDDFSRYKVMHVYSYPTKAAFLGTAQDLIGKVCKECFLAFMEFEFLWEENKILAVIEQDAQYEAWKQEGCQNCDRC